MGQRVLWVCPQQHIRWRRCLSTAAASQGRYGAFRSGGSAAGLVRDCSACWRAGAPGGSCGGGGCDGGPASCARLCRSCAQARGGGGLCDARGPRRCGSPGCTARPRDTGGRTLVRTTADAAPPPERRVAAARASHRVSLHYMALRQILLGHFVMRPAWWLHIWYRRIPNRCPVRQIVHLRAIEACRMCVLYGRKIPDCTVCRTRRGFGRVV